MTVVIHVILHYNLKVMFIMLVYSISQSIFKTKFAVKVEKMVLLFEHFSEIPCIYF